MTGIRTGRSASRSAWARTSRPHRLTDLLAASLALTVCVAWAPPAAADQPDRTAATAGADALLPIRYDADTGKLLLTIRQPGVEMLHLVTLATGLGTASPLLDRGQVGSEALVRCERHGPRVLLVQRNTAYRAATAEGALRRSVEESFPTSVAASFPVERDGPDGVVVDATDYFLTDAYDVAGSARQAGLGTVRVEKARSVIDGAYTRSFPGNTEIRATLTFVADAPDARWRQLAPDGRSLTLQQHHSFVALPDPPLTPRAFHPQAGSFANAFVAFEPGLDPDVRRRQVVRWRLEPSDPAAYARGIPVDPVKPIVYYLDPAIPEPYRSAFREGALWWSRVFEGAGFRNAFRVEDLPDGADPMDARYSVISWVHRGERGPSVGPAYVDPRTGEILKTIVRMDSFRSLVNLDVYMGLVPAAGPGGLQLSAEAFAMARRRQHAAHEVGHTLGLAHNFIAATQGRASVMDYPVALVRLDRGGQLDISEAYRPSPGAHDAHAIRYAYSWYPTPDAEAAGLATILREARQKGLRFVADEHAALSGSIPGATLWVEGDDMLQALERTMAVRRLLIDRFDERAARPGEALSVLNRRFAHVYLHHRSAVQGATKYIGGMEFAYALRGDGTEPTRVLPAAEQRRALALVLGALQPAALHIPARVAALIPPPPYGWGGDDRLMSSPAGPAFDPLTAAHSLAQEIVDGLLHPERAARVVSFHARDGEQLSLGDVVSALVRAAWLERETAGPPDAPALRRIVQRSVVDGLLDLAGDSRSTPDVRATVELHLTRLSEQLTAGDASGDAGHRATIVRDIERYFDGGDDRARRVRPQPIPLPWP